MPSIIGALKDSKAIDVTCGAPDCKGNHTTYDCVDVVMMSEGAQRETLDDADYPLLEEHLAKHLLVQPSTVVYPTMLGIWWEAVCDN